MRDGSTWGDNNGLNSESLSEGFQQTGESVWKRAQETSKCSGSRELLLSLVGKRGVSRLAGTMSKSMPTCQLGTQGRPPWKCWAGIRARRGLAGLEKPALLQAPQRPLSVPSLKTHIYPWQRQSHLAIYPWQREEIMVPGDRKTQETNWKTTTNNERAVSWGQTEIFLKTQLPSCIQKFRNMEKETPIPSTNI